MREKCCEVFIERERKTYEASQTMANICTFRNQIPTMEIFIEIYFIEI